MILILPQSIQKPREPANASLEFDRYLDKRGDNNEAQRNLFERLAKATVPSLYKQAFARWQDTLTRLGAQTMACAIHGRMIVGLGIKSVHEVGIALHRLYGVPVIPATALKGLAVSYARRGLETALSDEQCKVLFGSPESRAYVTVFDAWYVPGSTEKDKPLALDTITVHHPRYYGSGAREPWDFDDPTPVAFLSARGTYLIAVSGPEGWRDAYLRVLELALAEWGVGAKTSSGYGYGKPTAAASSTSTNETANALAAPGRSGTSAISHDAQALIDQVKAIPASRIVSQAKSIDDQAARLSPSDAAHVYRALLARIDEAKLRPRFATQPWFQRMLATLGEQG